MGVIEPEESEAFSQLYHYNSNHHLHNHHHHYNSSTSLLEDVSCQLFRHQSIPSQNNTIEMLSLLPILHSHGAVISRDLTCEVTHVVTTSSNPQRHSLIERRLRDLRFFENYRHEKRIVSPKWVYDCLKEKKLLVPSTRSQHFVQLTNSS